MAFYAKEKLSIYCHMNKYLKNFTYTYVSERSLNDKNIFIQNEMIRFCSSELKSSVYFVSYSIVQTI